MLITHNGKNVCSCWVRIVQKNIDFLSGRGPCRFRMSQGHRTRCPVDLCIGSNHDTGPHSGPRTSLHFDNSSHPMEFLLQSLRQESATRVEYALVTMRWITKSRQYNYKILPEPPKQWISIFSQCSCYLQIFLYITSVAYELGEWNKVLPLR